MSASSPIPEDVRRDIERMAGPLAQRMLPPKVTQSATTRNVVAAVNSDGTVDVMMGGAVMQHVPATTACVGVAVGDEVIVEQYGPRLYCVGVVAKSLDNSHYVTGKVFIGSTVLQSSAQGGNVLFSSPGNFVETFGREFDYMRDFVIMYNGDGKAVPYCTIAPEFLLRDGVQEIVARMSRSIGEGQLFRVNWLVYLGE